MELTQQEQDRLAELKAIPPEQRPREQHLELAALLGKRDRRAPEEPKAEEEQVEEDEEIEVEGDPNTDPPSKPKKKKK